jgi:hypothetical protein
LKAALSNHANISFSLNGRQRGNDYKEKTALNYDYSWSDLNMMPGFSVYFNNKAKKQK